MKRTYQIKYKHIDDLINECRKLYNVYKSVYTDEERKTSKDILSDWLGDNYDIKLNDVLYITCAEDFIDVYHINQSFKSLIFKIKDFTEAEFTELGESMIAPRFQESVRAEISWGEYTAFLLNKLYKTNKVKVIKGKFRNKLKIKGINLDLYFYPEADGNYVIDNKKDKVNIMVNNFSKLLKTVPIKEYPLPNSSEIKVFSSDNTENIEENLISELLSKETFKAGNCYSNSDRILEILNSNNVEKKIEFYAGWLLAYGNMIHHGWLVIDDKHIIDTALLLEKDDTAYMMEAMAKGKMYNLNKRKNAEFIAEKINSDKKFKEKYYYGKVPDDYLYIGVKSNILEAKHSYEKLMRTIPNHEEYRYINSRGSNETLDIINKKMK